MPNYIKSLRNLFIDLRFGGRFLGGSKKTPFSHLGAYNTVNSDYALLSKIFSNRIQKDDVLVDVGCGKGRVLNYWLSLGLKNKIYGLELDSDVALATKTRLKRYKNVSVIEGDAIDNLPEDSTVLYLFNPFSETIMERFINRIETMFDKREIRIIYYYPKHIHLFRKPSWELEEIPNTNPRIVVIKKSL